MEDFLHSYIALSLTLYALRFFSVSATCFPVFRIIRSVSVVATIPEKFLAKAAIAPTPAGFVPSGPMPAYGLVAGEGGKPVFSEDDVAKGKWSASSRQRVLINQASGMRRK